MDNVEELENWISVREASEISGYVTEYIRELARDGEINSVKMGNAVLINKKSLKEYMDKMKERK